jgi:hypothetical protein
MNPLQAATRVLITIALLCSACDEFDVVGLPGQNDSAKGSGSSLSNKLVWPTFKPALPIPYENVLDTPPVEPKLAKHAATTKTVRHLQQDAGNSPAFMPDGRWNEGAESVLGQALALNQKEGFNDEGLGETLGKLQLELMAMKDEAWNPKTNLKRALLVIRIERLLGILFLELADHLGAIRPAPPETKRAAEDKLLKKFARTPEIAQVMEPTDPGYWKLKAALKRYETLQKRGGLSPLPKGVRKLKPGSQGPMVALLRLRLALEDPSLTPDGDTWDDALTASLRGFRLAHQLRRKRKAKHLLDKKLVRALSQPIAKRVATLKRNIKRWRKSALRDHTYKLFMNLPDFHGELWDGAKQLHRFKIIIGSARFRGKRRVNATPLLSSYVTTIIYNPYWNVPKRIALEELLPMAERKSEESEEGLTPEEILEKKGYEIRNKNPAKPILRMKPGPRNALGKVKFIFENRHFVFLHDTPSKRKFRPIRRAFSHGCMRVHQPLTLAEILIKRDGTWHLVLKKKVFKHYRETPITLKKPIPIVVEYFTARVDDEGMVHWLHDVYKKDRDAKSPL